jgi:DNA repair exonuclease SbcCD ATPase subunit
MGHRYRKEIKVDSQSGKSEGKNFIDGSDVSTTAGAISEYKKWAVQTFGSEELFFASNFKAQGATDVSKMTAGKLKALFAEFLRLDRYEAWADTAKQAGNILQGQAGALGNRLAALCAELNSKSGTQEKIDDEKERQDDRKWRLAVEQGTLTKKRQEADSLKEIIQKNALALQRRADIQGQIDRLTAELAKEKETAAAEIKALEEKWKGIKQEITTAYALLQNKVASENAAKLQQSLEFTATNLQAAIDGDQEKLPGYQARVAEVEKQIVELRQQIAGLEKDVELADATEQEKEAERHKTALKKDMDALVADAELSRLLQDLEYLSTAANVGDGIDSDCKSATCAAIKSVNEAKLKTPAAIAAIEKRQDELDKLKNDKATEIKAVNLLREALAEKISKRCGFVTGEAERINANVKALDHDLRNAQTVLQGTNEILTFDRQKLKTIKDQIAQQKALADRLPEIQIAEARKADLEKQLAEVTEQGTNKKNEWVEKENGYHIRINELCDDRMVIDGQLLTHMKADAALVTVQTEIKEIETVKIPEIEKEIQAARDKITTLQNELTKIEQAEKELDQVRAEREALTAKIARWKYLQIGCGQNGLQALEIDGATPAINDRANKLLYQGYGQEFTIKVVTQDERGRECLDIMVISEHGEELLSVKSPGEQAWLLQPIRLSMGLLNREKSGREFDMAIFDESDGPMDAEGSAQSYMEMYRPYMEMGGVKQLIFISHKKECRAYADHILHFEKGEHPRWQ